MSKFLQEKRKTRGLRMADLIGKAADEDDTFWNNEVWAEEESDASFSEEEVKPDVFDSDFNDSEDDNEEENSDDETGRKRDGETGNKSSSNRYKEPHQIKRITHKKVKTSLKSSSSDDADQNDDDDVTNTMTSKKSTPKLKKIKLESSLSSSSSLLEASGPRHIRDSTKIKSIEFENRLKTSSSSISSSHGHGHGHKKEKESKEGTFHQFTQKELLMDALETEKFNKTWLESQKFTNEQSNSTGNSEEALKHLMNRQNGGNDDDGDNGMIRTLSRRGTYNTITFTEDSLIPTCLQRKKPLPIIPEKMCVITGQPAKYKDPYTHYPYANLTAYQELRKRYPINNRNHANTTNTMNTMPVKSRQRL